MEQPKITSKKDFGNPEAINDAYKLFTETGYKKSKEEFVALINSNPEALKDAHKLFVETGYKKDLNEFSNLLGVKKKEVSDSTSQQQKSVSEQKPSSSGSNQKYTLPKYNEPADVNKDELYDAEANTGIAKMPTGKGNSLYESTKKSKFVKPNAVSENISKLYQEAGNSTAVSEDKKNEIVKDVDSEIEGTGAWNTIKSGAAKVINPLYRVFADWSDDGVKSELISTDPLSEEKKQVVADYQLQKKKDKTLPDLTPEEIQSKARDLKIDKKVKETSDSQLKEFIVNLKAQDKSALKYYAAEAKNSLSQRDKFILEKKELYAHNLESSIGNVQNIEKQINDFRKRGEPIQQDLVDMYEAAYSEYQKNLKDAEGAFSEYANNSEKLGDFSDNLDVFKRDYSLLANLSGSLKASAYETAGGVAGLFDYASNIDKAIFGETERSKNVSERSRDFSKAAIELAEEEKAGIAKPLGVDAINSAEDFGTWVSQIIGGQIPTLALAGAGKLGISTIGVTSTGQKYESMVDENEAGTSDYSTAQMITLPPIFGTTETVGAAIEASVLRNAGRVLKSATKVEKNAIFKSGWDTLKKSALESGKNFTRNTLKEVGEETGTQFAQNLAMKTIGGKQDQDLLEGVKDAGAAAFALSTVLAGVPNAVKLTAETVNTFTADNAILENARALNKIDSQLLSSGLNVAQRRILQSQSEKLENSLREKIILTTKDIGAMSNKTFNEILNTDKKRADIQKQAQEIEKSSIDADAKKIAIDVLKSEYDGLEQRRKDLIERGAESELEKLKLPEEELISLKDKAARELMKEQNSDGTKSVTITDEDISKRAFQIYNDNEAKRVIKEMDSEKKFLEDTENLMVQDISREGRLLDKHKLYYKEKAESDVANESWETENFNALKKGNGVLYEFKDNDRHNDQIETFPSSMEVHLEEDNFNRVHAGDLSESNKNKGFGKEIYTDLINRKGIISTQEEDSSVAAKRVWDSLINSGNYYWAKVGDFSAVANNESDINEFIKSKSDASSEVISGSPNSKENIDKNEEAPGGDIVTDGNLQSGTAVMEQDGNTVEESSVTGNVQEPAYAGTGQNTSQPKTIKIKTSGNSEDYDVTFNGNRVEIKDKNGKEPSINTRKKIEEKYSEQVDFTKGKTALSEGKINDVSSWEEDIAQHSENPVEVAETIINLRAQDATEFLDTKSKAIAEAIGGKSINRESFTQFGDRNNINQSIALQYFSKKGEGQGIDQIAMAAEEAIYGDYDAVNPRVTTQDVIDFINDNPGGAERFINSAKNEKMKSLKEAFTFITGLPANDKYISKAIEQAKAKDEYVNNFMTELDTFTDEQLLSLLQEKEQSDKEFYGTAKKESSSNADGAGRIETSNSQESAERPGIQEESGRDDSREQESERVNLSKDSGLDSFIENIDKAIRKLDDFGKDTLGMNLPIVVARQALLAMKVAAQTASTVADIISAGLNAVKESDWYKNLSKKEKSDIDTNFVDYLNKPYKMNRQKTRFKIEEEVDAAVSEGKSEDEIIDSYPERRDKMIAKDYMSRQKSVTETQAKKHVDKSFKKADDALTDKKPAAEKINLSFRKFMASIIDRQFVPKFILNKAGGKLVRNYLIATKGATGYAKVLYDEAYDKIYKGLSSQHIKTLDKVIQLRRFIAIDENRAKSNLPAVVHPDYINENVAKKYLQSLENELGSKEYSDLTSRSDAYFDSFRGLLNEMHKSGIISKESRDQFFEIDYQPRQFLQFLKNTEDEVQFDAGSNAGLSQPQIKKLEDGLDTSLVYDSQYLLSRSINARTKAIAMNNTNKKLVEFIKKQGLVVSDLKQKTNPTKKELETIKYFGELSKKVKLNPITGFSLSGEPKYKITDKEGYKNAYYYENGVKNNILMEPAFHDQYFDALRGIFKTNQIKENITMASGVGVVKAFATGSNPTFFITNTPRDFMFISTFSEEYGKNVLLNMAKLSKDTFNGIKDIVKTNDNFKNFIKYGGMMDFLKDQGKFKGNNGLNRLIDKIDNKNQERLGKAFSVATLSKLQTYSEIGFRMAVFNRSIKNQLKEFGLKNISEIEDKSMLDDIYTNAVASARSTMDFNQGGIYTKDADALIPYLNAATQGTRVMFDNFRERPVETTFRVTQTAAILSSAAIGTSLLLLAGTDDDEHETASARYQFALKGISQYEKTNYFIIFTGNKSSDGEYEYYRIAKSQQLTPFFSLAEGVINKFMKAGIGDESADETINNIGFALDKNISPIDFSISGNLAKNPLAKASLTYATGYDFYREQDLSYMKGKVPVQAEGFENKNVEDFYKKIGEEAGMSPVRMKAAVESLITTPSTSPYVGFLYGGLDALASDKDGKAIMQKLGEDIQKSTLKRLKKETSDFNRRMSNNDELKKKFAEVEIENSKTRAKFKHLADGIIQKTTTEKEVVAELLELAKENPIEAKRLAKMIKDRVKNQDVSSYVFEIKYAKSAEHKAILLVEMFGDNLKDFSKLSKEEKTLVNQLGKMSAINKEVIFEYNKIVNEKATD